MEKNKECKRLLLGKSLADRLGHLVIDGHLEEVVRPQAHRCLL